MISTKREKKKLCNYIDCYYCITQLKTQMSMLTIQNLSLTLFKTKISSRESKTFLKVTIQNLPYHSQKLQQSPIQCPQSKEFHRISINLQLPEMTFLLNQDSPVNLPTPMQSCHYLLYLIGLINNSLLLFLKYPPSTM